MNKIEVNIQIVAEKATNGINLYRKGHPNTRQIWLRKSGGKVILRDRWFYIDGGWKDMGHQEFPRDPHFGILREQEAIEAAVSMLATSGIDSGSQLVRFLKGDI